MLRSTRYGIQHHRPSARHLPVPPRRARAMAAQAPAAAPPRVLVPIAEGSEEMEAVIIVDTLRRAEVDVCVASVEASRTVTASRGVCIEADMAISECQGPYDMIALPVRMPRVCKRRDLSGGFLLPPRR